MKSISTAIAGTGNINITIPIISCHALIPNCKLHLLIGGNGWRENKLQIIHRIIIKTHTGTYVTC